MARVTLPQQHAPPVLTHTPSAEMSVTHTRGSACRAVLRCREAFCRCRHADVDERGDGERKTVRWICAARAVTAADAAMPAMFNASRGARVAFS